MEMAQLYRDHQEMRHVVGTLPHWIEGVYLITRVETDSASDGVSLVDWPPRTRFARALALSALSFTPCSSLVRANPTWSTAADLARSARRSCTAGWRWQRWAV